MRNNNNLVLVVGANGKLGQSICFNLKSKGFTIIGTTKNDEAIPFTDYQLKSNLFEGSCNELIRNCKKIEERLRLKISKVFYVAGFGYNEKLITDKIKREMVQVNCNAAVHLYKSFKKAKFIYFSSCSVLGITGTEGHESYTFTKRLAMKLLQELAEKYGGCVIIVLASIINGTNFNNRAGYEDKYYNGFMDAEQVARYVIDKIFNTNQVLILPGWQAKILYFLNKFSPKFVQKFLKI